MRGKAIILVNVGSPEEPSVRAVRKYLSQFLNDPLVIDLPPLLRRILVNFLILPFRSARSAAMYREIWTEGGAPLVRSHQSLAKRLQTVVPDGVRVYGVMRYGRPSFTELMDSLRRDPPQEVVVFPMYPQEAASTTGSVRKEGLRCLESWPQKPNFRIAGAFYHHPAYLRVFADRIRACQPLSFERIVFSYHSLPLRHLQKDHPAVSPETCHCHREKPLEGHFCYRAACYDTSRLLVAEAGLPEKRCLTAFQSAMGKQWLGPFTEEVLLSLARQGVKKVLVVLPGFTADNLETLFEVRKTFADLFLRAGGEELVMADSLNDREEWVQALSEILGEG